MLILFYLRAEEDRKKVQTGEKKNFKENILTYMLSHLTQMLLQIGVFWQYKILLQTHF